jgi:uncharacterized membrane protein
MSVNYVKGQILSSNLERDGIDLSISNANVGINTVSPASTLEVVGDITVGNVVISNIGNVTVGNVNINDLAEPVANTDAATKFYVDTVSGNITGIGNLEVVDTTITSTTANANISIDPNGTGTFVIVGTNGFVMPAGTTAQRPATGNVAGTLRFNTDTARMEVYDGTEWDQVVGGVTSQTIETANGVTTDFNLDRKTTTAATLVMLNGVVQLPSTSYSITGAGSNVLTFAQAPVSSDIIDVRFL